MPILRLAPDETFKALCSSTVAVGDLIYVTPTGSVERADPYDRTKMPALGVVIAKLSSTRAHVRSVGRVLVYSGLTPGTLYGVGADSRPSSVLVPGPARRWLQAVGTALDTNVLLLSFFPPHGTSG